MCIRNKEKEKKEKKKKELTSENKFPYESRICKWNNNLTTLACHAETDPTKIKLHSYVRNKEKKKKSGICSCNVTSLFAVKKVFQGFCDPSVFFQVFQAYSNLHIAILHDNRIHSVWAEALRNTPIGSSSQCYTLKWELRALHTFCTAPLYLLFCRYIFSILCSVHHIHTHYFSRNLNQIFKHPSYIIRIGEEQYDFFQKQHVPK